MAAGFAGALIGFFASSHMGWPAVWSLVGGFLFGALPTYLATAVLSQVSTAAFVSTVAPSGRSTPSRPDYSLAKTYLVQGRFPQAIAEYRKHIGATPTDPEPCLQLARLYRDDLKDLEESVKWFRQAVAVAADPRVQYLGVRELAEVFVSRIKEPRRALPDLARFADQHPGTASGDWARQELEQIKRDAAWEG
jgi:tetratricopeptide (TPR) repeat protein